MKDRKSLGDLAARGIVWITGQSIFARFVSYFSQLALAWFLTEDDFGLFGMALTISEFSRVFSQGGVSKVLVQRQKSFDKWSTPGFWLSLVMSLGVAFSMIIVGYFATGWFQVEEPKKLLQLICLLAIVPPISAIGTIPKAALQIELKFGAIAAIGTVALIIGTVAKVGLAWGGWGAFSFVIPMLISIPIQTLCYWLLVRPKIKLSLMFRKWKYLISDGAMIIATGFWYKIITHGDYVILGAIATQKELGLYFFAFTCSIQAIVMLTQGIASIAFPALARLSREPQRQLEAFRKGATALAAIVFPASVAQAILFKPIVEEFFPVRWIPAIVMLQILSLGMAGRTVSWVSASLMEAQGRFKTRMWLGLVSAVTFIAIGITGATVGNSTSMGPALGLAIAVTIYYPIMSLATTWIALPSESQKWSIIREIYVAPTLLSFLAFAPPYLFAVAFTSNRYVHIGATAILGTAVYILIGRVWMKPIWNDIISRGMRLVSTRFPKLKLAPQSSINK